MIKRLSDRSKCSCYLLIGNFTLDSCTVWFYLELRTDCMTLFSLFHLPAFPPPCPCSLFQVSIKKISILICSWKSFTRAIARTNSYFFQVHKCTWDLWPLNIKELSVEQSKKSGRTPDFLSMSLEKSKNPPKTRWMRNTSTRPDMERWVLYKGAPKTFEKGEVRSRTCFSFTLWQWIDYSLQRQNKNARTESCTIEDWIERLNLDRLLTSVGAISSNQDQDMKSPTDKMPYLDKCPNSEFQRSTLRRWYKKDK